MKVQLTPLVAGCPASGEWVWAMDGNPACCCEQPSAMGGESSQECPDQNVRIGAGSGRAIGDQLGECLQRGQIAGGLEAGDSFECPLQ